jgi:hypothetical protein
VTPAFESLKEQQVKEYVKKHDKLPPCMEPMPYNADE